MSEHLSFERLVEIRNYLGHLRRGHVVTMNYFASLDKKGFWHQLAKRHSASLSSTATCVSSLVRANLWLDEHREWGKTADVAECLLKRPWESAGLLPNNPFSLSFIAEGVLDLAEVNPYERDDLDRDVVHKEIMPLLVEALKTPSSKFGVPGSVAIDPYPSSAYLTQLVFRVIQRCSTPIDRVDRDVVGPVRAWARNEVHRQIALITTQSRIADPSQLAYAIILLATTSAAEQASPEDKSLQRAALQIFFDQQKADGLWPSSQPLFHYPSVGNAFCFEYELLTQLLKCEALQDDLFPFAAKLERSALHLSRVSFEIGMSKNIPIIGWASGHHPQIQGAESWATACVYDFVYEMDRFTAEGIRRAIFSEMKQVYSKPRSERIAVGGEFAAKLLDSKFEFEGATHSLKKTIFDRFVKPISEEKAKVASGGRLSDRTPMSAIMFGPPGTSKTQLAELISDFLGWPLLGVDPSYLVQDGLENLYSRSNKLFHMLEVAEQIVVLLDEFDEMGRDRSSSSDLLSRFTTTSMLPKLVAINKERKIVFLLATNYVSSFDAAFSRGGRFDMIIQVMVPSLEEKLGFASWSELGTALNQYAGDDKVDLENSIADLTFLETRELVKALKDHTQTSASREIKRAQERGTMARENGEKSWKKTSADDQKYIRLPS